MAKVTLFYRDGGNNKSVWDAHVPDEVMRNLPPPDTDGLHDIGALGLKVTDIPLIQRYGYADDIDHPFVTVEEVVMDGERGQPNV